MRRTIMGVVVYALLVAGASAQTQNTKDLLAQLEREQPIVCGGVADKDTCNATFVATIRAIHHTEKQTTLETIKASFEKTDRLLDEIIALYEEHRIRKQGKVSLAK